MRASDCDILILPGFGGGTLEHWYTRWSRKLSTARRVEQEDFDHPILTDWRAHIEGAARGSQKPVVFIGHSLGAVAAVHASASLDNVVAGFFVAPPSPEKICASPAIDPAFAEILEGKLRYSAVLVASRTDDWCPYEQSELYAKAWGATLVDAGDAGHINPDSGFGPWPEGLLRLAHFLNGIKLNDAAHGDAVNQAPNAAPRKDEDC